MRYNTNILDQQAKKFEGRVKHEHIIYVYICTIFIHNSYRNNHFITQKIHKKRGHKKD